MLLAYYLTIFYSKYTCAACFFTQFSVLFRQKSKKICQFFAIFSRCVSMIYEKVEKKVCQKT